MRKTVACLMVLGMVFSVVSYGEDVASDAPWWKTEKIRFMWGKWVYFRLATNVRSHKCELPHEVFSDLAQAGATVFAELEGYSSQNARFAHECGLRYFATLYAAFLHKVPGERKAITEAGEPSHWRSPWCPLDQAAYDKWIVEPHLEGARQGLVDGIHFDWERYVGGGEADICYCDDCFSNFPAFKKSGDKLPEKVNRFAWVTERELVPAYEENFHKRRVEMFTRIRQKLQAANPRLLFSSYGTVFSDFTRAMNTPETPFIFLDSRHYYDDDRQAWWESYGSRLREEGYLYIPGGWTNALFGAQASQVSAARWIYEAAINKDGVWLWFARELDDEILRAYATADRRIEAVQGKVGNFLFGGTRDPNFTTAVEWTGRPELEKAVIHQTYHLDNEHLVHVSNVNTEWPLRVRLRFPRLGERDGWTVRDAMSELYYSRDGMSAEWSRDDLLAGVVITLDPRSDLYLVLSVPESVAAALSDLVHSREFDALGSHEAAAGKVAPIKETVTLYTMKNAVYDKALDELVGSTKEVFALPKEGWRFRMDKEDMGSSEKWYLPTAPMDDWVEIETEAFWGAKGGSGAGWYRRDIDVPTLPEGERVYLYFGAVDEEIVLWIDGEYSGDYQHPRGPGYGWDKPFAIEVSDKLTAGKHHLALRVHNVAAAGGVWKPVTLRVGGERLTRQEDPEESPLEEAGPQGHLAYTATEPIGFGGPGGLMTIGNAIRTIKADDQTQVRIRKLRGHLWSPRYSPDGARIAFVHDAGGRGQVFVMNADGSEGTNLSDNDFCDRSPRWSPDGQAIAFVSDRAGDWDIYAMDADGSDQRRLAGNPGLDRAPTWSPDGKRLAWESHVSGIPGIWVVGADGAGSRPLIAPDRQLTIAVGNVGKNKVFNFAPVAWPFADNTFYMMDPVWSPDPAGAGHIAAVLVGADSAHTVAVVDADGSRMLLVITWFPSVRDLVWSPDGARLAGAWRTAPSESERAGIFVVKADSTDENRYGQWLVDVTPQGPRLGGARRSGLMSWYSHGSAQPRRVVKTFTSLAWSPNGKTLAFSSDMDPSGAFYLYTISPDGGEPHRLDGTISAWPNEIMWRPISSREKGR